jgi:hypothetical protein
MTALLEKFSRRTESTRAELALKQRELDERATKAAELQAEAERLQRNVDDAADRLVRADSQFAAFKERATQLRRTLGEAWSSPPRGQHGIVPAVDYSGLLAVEAAISDFPRVREVLAKDVSGAQAALKKFEVEQREFFDA